MATSSNIAKYASRVIAHGVNTSTALGMTMAVGFDNAYDNYYCLGIPITTPAGGTTTSVKFTLTLKSTWGSTSSGGNSTWKLWVSSTKYQTTSSSKAFSSIKGNVTQTFSTSTASASNQTQTVNVTISGLSWGPGVTYYVYIYNLISSTGYHCMFDLTNFTAIATYTLYTYTVSYNANGGSGAPSNQTKTWGVALTLSSTKPTRAGYEFLGWGTGGASDTTVDWNPGASYTTNANLTLHAIWKLNACVRIYDGSSWRFAIPYVYDGSSWRQAIPYVYDGSTWRISGG